MLPTSLVATYQQYKQDTDAVASWIASTAKACGYPANLLSSKSWDVPRPPLGRLKGKARKDAQKVSMTGPPKPPKYIVALNDFLPLANFIAQRQNPVVSVPDVFSTTLDRLITVRSGFRQQMVDHGAEPDTSGDQKHGYFVSILEAVRDTLRPHIVTTADRPMEEVATKSKAAAAADVADLTNPFAALSVEHPTQTFLDGFLHAAYERPKPHHDDPLAYEAEPPTHLEDILFMFAALVTDLNRIRSRIQWIWSNHRCQIIDLAAAAVATNTAISLARGLTDDIVPLFNAHKGGAWDLTTKYFTICCLDKGHRMDEIFLDKKDNFNYDLYDIADSVYLVPFQMLVSFLDILDPRELPLINEGIFGKYDPDSDRATKTGQQKFQEDKIVLTEFFTEVMTVIRVVPDYPVEDEFLHGMRELDKTHTVPFSLVFAAQIFLDIHHIMRNDIHRSFWTMSKQVQVMRNSLDNHFEFHNNQKLENWPAANDRMLRELSQLITWMGEDPVHNAKAKVLSKRGMPIPASMEANRILIYSPILAGLLLFRFRAETYEIGISVANAWGSLVYSAHLYNALLSEKLLTKRWYDMRIALTLLGDSSFWVGGERPRTAEGYFKKFCLQMGVTASAFTNPARGRRNTTIASRAGPRGIKDGIPVSSMFVSGAKRAMVDVDWTAERIDDIVARSEYQYEGSAEHGAFTMTQIDDPDELRQRTRVREQMAKARAAGKKTVSDGAQLAPEQLIRALALALHAETLQMAFPYLTLHRMSWRLLRAVKESCDPILRSLYTPMYTEKENQLPLVVGYIFMAASGGNYTPMQSATAAFNGLINSGSGQISIQLAKEVGFDIEFEGIDLEDIDYGEGSGSEDGTERDKITAAGRP